MISFIHLANEATCERLKFTIGVAHNPNLPYSKRLVMARDRLELGAPTDLSTQAWYEQARDWLAEDDRHFITCLGDEDYPQNLLALKNPPIMLYGAGNSTLLHARSLAMVGSRHASTGGGKLAHHFAQNLANKGWVIISGLAEGIDGASHAGALEATGATIAVLGSGIGHIYPAIHRGLANKIMDVGGLVISEYPPSTGPRRAFFPQRNRIIAALADGTLVVEAAPRSGSLITARVSSELGRPTMAIPGSIHSPHSKGCHAMIKDGALLVETTNDIEHELLGALPPNRLAPAIADANPPSNFASNKVDCAPQRGSLEKALLKAMGHEARHIDELAHQLGQSIDNTLGMLTELELEGVVVSEAGSRWQRINMPG